MRRHIKHVHEETTMFLCNKCNKKFNRADNLIRHQKVCSKFYFDLTQFGKFFHKDACT